MSASFVPEMYAIDFGTSNSLLAAASAERSHPPIPLDQLAPDPTIFRSILFFENSQRCRFGSAALEEYVACGMQGRLVRSLKKYLPDRSFVATRVDNRPFVLEDLIGAFLGEMRARADRFFETRVERVLIGRPARFSEDESADALAERRLERAALQAGFKQVTFCPEPVAAARDFRQTLDRPKLMLTADLGAGTSDFSIVRLRPEGYAPSDVLATGGISIAGDALDGSLMRHQIAEHFGARVTYRLPLGNNVLSMPTPLIERLCSPAETALLQQRDIMAFIREIRDSALGPDDRRRIEQLICLVEDALGFQLFEVIEQTKRALSAASGAQFQFDYPGIAIREQISRAKFEQSCAKQMAAILHKLDETLRLAGLRAEAIDLCCCTGGTALVPWIARALEQRFGAPRIHRLSSFHAVCQGLAEQAQSLLR